MSTFSATAAISLILLANADAQGLSAKATVSAPSTESEFKLLRQQLSALEARVHKLESKADDVKNDGDGDDAARGKKLEKQLEKQLETIQEAQRHLESALEAARHEGTTHAKAPFVVYDKDDHAIFRVEVSVNNEARIAVGNPLGTHAVMWTSEERKNAGINMVTGTDGTNSQVAIIADKESVLSLASPETKQRTVLGGKADKTNGLTVLNGAVPLAYFGSKESGKGYLEIDDAAGEKMIEAGSLDSHKGYVLAQPWQPSRSPGGDPSVLKGGGSK